ncbi:MAG TPA: ABC transporter permease [Actinocrinis sp.]|nr:ABC transporter permease [Actinocrinis sp.]
MSVSTATDTIPDRPLARWSAAAALRRTRSIGRAEVLLLWRNRAALMNAVLTPVAVVALAATAHVGPDGSLSEHAFLVTSLLGFVILSTVYYTLVSTYVARREGLVLKRLRVGEITDAEILTGVASPALVLALGQIVVFGVGAALFLKLPVPVNAPVLLLGAAGGMLVFALLAAASAVFTKTVEMAQVTTLPVIFASLVGSGAVLPLDELPRAVADVLDILPLTPVLTLMRLGWQGTSGKAAPADFVGVLGDALVPAGLLLAWTVVGVLVVRRWFRWESRR